MGLNLRLSPMISCLPMVFMLACASAFQEQVPQKFFDVMSYGAVADGKTDNSKAFLRTWKYACKWEGRSRVWIPKGTFLLDSVVFSGPCKGSMAFLIKGELLATVNPSKFSQDWINFQYVDRLTIKGGGYLHGQGALVWPYNNCGCRSLPSTMALNFVRNARVNHLRSIDSKNTHFKLFACENVTMDKIRITAPEESPNTDGIKIGNSTNIKIHDTVIGTGDDCIALISGCRDIDVSRVKCGPGHGISIGSLGTQPNKPMSLNSEQVTGIRVRDSSLHGTQNGLRIKTWATSFPGLASDIRFQNIVMEDVGNPIFIDQKYCPRGNCNDKAQSHVQVRNVTFRNVRGTSVSQEAVKIKCSQQVPCQDVVLMNIYLDYNGPEGPVTSLCSNVNGESYGRQLPAGCLKHVA